MGKIRTGIELYRDGGVQDVAARGMKLLFRDSAFSGILEGIVGAELAEKLTNWFAVGYWPQIKNPRSFNEKVMHRKLYTDNPAYPKLEDKWAVREYVREHADSEILPEVYHVTDDPDTIPFENLPTEFVVKPNNGSGEVLLIDSKDNVDFEAIRAQCRDWLATHNGENNHEYWYKRIKPRILIEERLHDEEHGIPRDYKFFVFHGHVEYIHVDSSRFSRHERRFYDRDWNAQEFTYGYPLGPDVEEPAQLEEMIAIAERLGEGFDFVRVDLYQPERDRVVFGEMTIGPESGRGRFTPVEYDFKLGSMW